MANERVSMSKIMKVVSLPTSNRCLPEPFEIGEKVIFIGELDESIQPESFRKQFVRIKRLKTKSVQTESRKHFEIITKK